MFLVPTDTPGVNIVRNVGLGGEPLERGLHALIHYDDVRVPADELLGGEGQAFAIAQTRLGGGRIHHAMRTIGLAQKALDMMCERALSRETQGSLLADKQFVQGYIADSYAQLVQFRLFVLYTAWMIDKYNDYKRGPQGHRRGQGRHADRAARHRLAGDAGARRPRRQQRDAVLRDDPRRRVMGLADGPTEVHKVTVARQVLRDYKPSDDLWPTEHLPRSSRRPGPSTPSTSSTRWATCDRRRPARRLDGRRGPAGKGEPLEHRFISGGSQNEIYEIRRGELHGAPHPAARRRRRAATTGIRASGGSSRRSTAPTCPTPRPSPRAPTPTVLGRTFYLMGFVDGWSPMGLDATALAGAVRHRPRGPRGWPTSWSRASPCSAKVDWRAKGLEDLGRPDGFHERQVDRWTAFLERIKGRELPGFDEAAAWLRPPADRLRARPDARRLPVRQRDVPPRRTGAAGRHRRLGDGHGRRPQARPRLGRAELARGHLGGRSGRPAATST